MQQRYFNPHSHEGSDVTPYTVFNILIKISIHTPTKGATQDPHQLLFQSQYFNPHSHEGSDISCFHKIFHDRSFQSTLPRRERLDIFRYQKRRSLISIHTPTKGATGLAILRDQLQIHFNPHSHEGSDRNLLTVLRLVVNFNPHSHEGSDELYFTHFLHSGVFQSTLPRRERRLFYIDTYQKCISIHTPTKGATIIISISFMFSCNFNPHSHEGSDCNINQ